MEIQDLILYWLRDLPPYLQLYLLLPRVPKLPNQYYSNRSGNLSKLVSSECNPSSTSQGTVAASKEVRMSRSYNLTLKVLVTTTDAQWEGMGDVGSARYEPALLPPCPTIRVLSYSNW